MNIPVLNEPVDVSQPRLYRDDSWALALCAAEARGPGPLASGEPVRALLVDYPLRRHYPGRARSGDLLVVPGAGRNPDRRPAQG